MFYFQLPASYCFLITKRAIFDFKDKVKAVVNTQKSQMSQNNFTKSFKKLFKKISEIDKWCLK